VDVQAVNRRGRHTTVKVTCTAFRSSEGSINGALLLMEDMG
jgi:two-component system, chemotaxis family, CheB/CheR fusion protein